MRDTRFYIVVMLRFPVPLVSFHRYFDVFCEFRNFSVVISRSSRLFRSFLLVQAGVGELDSISFKFGFSIVDSFSFCARSVAGVKN